MVTDLTNGSYGPHEWAIREPLREDWSRTTGHDQIYARTRAQAQQWFYNRYVNLGT
ncbi:hypothetical protein QSH57_002132 [Fusarium oxysporum f. sp. vasinfectum]|nr:hypothetical protein QSH57_002132 [Fusarium oxysporum f. sp. vasinfectum]